MGRIRKNGVRQKKKDIPAKQKKKIPNFITVQRMSAEPVGRMKKYEPLDTRDFVDFPFDELSIENAKTAYKKHYNAPGHVTF